MKRLALIFLLGSLALPRSAEGKTDRKIFKTQVAYNHYPYNKGYLWQATYGLDVWLLPLDWYLPVPELSFNFLANIQTVGKENQVVRAPNLRDDNFEFQPELRFRFWDFDWLQTKLFAHHWSFHKVGKDQDKVPQINTFGLEGRLVFKYGYFFVQGQVNHYFLGQSLTGYNRPAVLGCRLEAILSDQRVWLYTNQMAEIGKLSFYSGESGIKIATPFYWQIEIFIAWNNGRQGVSSQLGAVPAETQKVNVGARVFWEFGEMNGKK